jgi:hypothetical protein
MNRYLNILFLWIIVFIGCEDKDVKQEFSEMPTSFTKKVLIEEFTGAWCGYCPIGAYIVESLIEENDNIIGIGVHSGDAMEVDHSSFLEMTYQNSGYPSGMVDRVSYDGYVSLNAGYWTFMANNRLSSTPPCGLAMRSKVSGGIATIEVHAGFNATLEGDHRLTVYLIEDHVTGSGYGYDQANYYDGDSSSTFYQLGNPIEGYEHNNTLRAVLSGSLGDPLDNSVFISGGEHVETYTIDISSYEKNNLNAVAFIHHVGSSVVDHEILNVQRVSINGFQDWD